MAQWPNASAALFVSARISQLALLPQGQPERHIRVLKMVDQMDAEGFGNAPTTASAKPPATRRSA